MPVKTLIEDGRGTTSQAGVTADNLVTVGSVFPSAADLTDAQLNRQRYLSESFIDAAGSSDMGVDGSVTPVEFAITGRAGAAVCCTGMRLVLNGVSLEIDTNDARRFGAATVANAPLPNGIEVEAHQGGRIVPIFGSPVTRLIEFLNFCDFSYLSLKNTITAQSDFFACKISFPQPIVLVPGSADKIVIRISDDLTPIDLFEAYIGGFQEFL